MSLGTAAASGASLMLTVAVVTLSRRKFQEKGGRWLKLLSGVVMLGLGILLIVRPEWLTRGVLTPP
ncbi:MAG: hypothetical protein HY695_30440 [Deltaproteobacteria bacterium]|nr:hypothetical protein [Deltaproteobacteria bacterium]